MKKLFFMALAMVLFAVHGMAENNGTTSQQGKTERLGADFLDATLVTLKGDSVKLSDYVGHHKYVLVDFWASWCGPCMREMPNVKAAYEKYKSRGLEIVGISLDRDKAAWEAAVKRVGITWPQATDYNSQGSKVATLYGVQYIPYIVVFDKNGKMVAKNLHGEALLQKLEELMPAK